MVDWNKLFDRVDVKVWLGPEATAPGDPGAPTAQTRTAAPGKDWSSQLGSVTEEVRRRPLFIGIEVKF